MFNIKQKFSTNFGASFLLVLNVFIFGTFTIYLANHSEFQTPYAQVISNLFFTAILSLIILLFISIILSNVWSTYFTLVIFSLAILTYIHGNLLLWDYGVLDGNDLNLLNDWRLFSDIIIWIFIFSIVFILKKKIINNITLLCTSLVLIQFAAAFVQLSQTPIDLKIIE